MNMAHLRAFHTVATEGGFTAAARALEVTQPTVSSQVTVLERRYGVRVFDRSARGISLTDTGHALFGITRKLFSLEQEAEELLVATRGLEEGQIRVGADGPHHIMPVLARFHRRYPRLRVSLAMGNAEQMLRELKDSRIDVALVAKVEDDPRLYSVVLHTSPLVLFVPISHPWARRDSIRLAEVAEQHMIVREAASATRQIFDDALTELGVRPQSVMQIESREAVREAVAAGLGIGVVSLAEFDPDPRLKALRIRDRVPTITEHVACLQERRRLRIVQAFLAVATAGHES